MNTWQTVWRLLTWRPVAFLWNCLTWSAFHAIPLAYGVLVKLIFDALSGHAPAGWNVWSLLAGLATAYASRQLVFLAGFRLFSRFYLSLQAFLRRNMLDHLVLAPKSRVLPESPSEAVSRFRDDVDDLTTYTESWIDGFGFIVYGVSAITALFLTDPLIAAVVCGPLILTMLLMRYLSPTIRTFRRRMREATARVTGFIGESFASAQAVKVASQEESMTAHLRSLGEARRKRALADVLLTELIRSVNNALVFTGTGFTLLLAASKSRDDSFTVGDLALFIGLLPRITNTLTFVGDMMAQHRRTRVATERISHLLVDAPPNKITENQPLELVNPAPSFQPLRPELEPLESLEVRNLSFTYPTTTAAGISEISFHLPRGGFLVITGRIGAGKTTLLRVLQGLLPKSSGEILWNGRIVEDPATFFTPPHSSYTAQVPRLFSESLRDNVLIGEPAGETGDEHLQRAMHLAAMGPDVAVLEHGFDTLVGNRGVKLSGGQVQRASAARMFARGSDLLIFDDLSSALDVATERQLWRSLFAGRQVTCLVVSHRRAALQRASHILLLEHGRVLAQGSLDQLLREVPEMRRLWDEEEEEPGG